MKPLALAAVCLGTLLAQPATAATFVFDFSGTLNSRTSPTTSTTPTPFSGRLEYEDGTTGNVTTFNGSADLFTDQYGNFHFASYSATIGSNMFSFSSVQQPGFAINVTRTSANSPYTGTFSITAAPIVNGTGTLTGSFSTGAVPEPATWLSMIVGFGLAGALMRRRGRGATMPRSA